MLIKNRSKIIDEIINLSTSIKEDFYGTPVTNNTIENILKALQLNSYTKSNNSVLLIEFLLERCCNSNFSSYSHEIFNIIFNSKLSDLIKKSKSDKTFNFILNNDSFLKNNIPKSPEVIDNIILFLESFFSGNSIYDDGENSNLEYNIVTNCFTLTLYCYSPFDVSYILDDIENKNDADDLYYELLFEFTSKVKNIFPDIYIYQNEEICFNKQIILNNNYIHNILDNINEFYNTIINIKRELWYDFIDKIQKYKLSLVPKTIPSL